MTDRLAKREKKETYENLCRWCAKANHGTIEDAANVQHGTVRCKSNQQKSQAVRDGDQHQCPPSSQNSQARSGSQASDQRRQRWYAAWVIQRNTNLLLHLSYGPEISIAPIRLTNPRDVRLTQIHCLWLQQRWHSRAGPCADHSHNHEWQWRSSSSSHLL